jgi:hypothetical protein
LIIMSSGGETDRVGLLAMLAVMTIGLSAVLAEETREIRDNSFLIEEAYNQEPGVIQHAQAFQYMKDKSWNYTFTDEWPVPRETHQLSITVPVDHVESDDTATGLGDVMLNYRYQLILKHPVALAPRLSLILPTGDEKKDLGDGAVGFQANIPLSVEMGELWVTHWNVGTTYIPRAKGPAGGRRDETSFNYGASLIYLASENFNLLLEAAGSSIESIRGGGLVERDDALFINPGVRFALNYECGLQVVPGIGVPIGTGPSDGEYGVFVYLSFEHPAF